MAILKYRSLFADVLPRRTPKHAPLKKPDAVSTSTSTSPPSLGSAKNQPPAYSQTGGERSRKPVKVYPKPADDEVLSVTIRLRGDCHGEMLTTTVTFHAFDGLQNQIQACLFKNFGKGAIGIATPRGKVITEDWQIYQLAYPGVATSFCNVVYVREDEKIHPAIVAPAAKLLVEMDKKSFYRYGKSMFIYLDPNDSYSTTYIDQQGLNIINPADVGLQKDLAVRKGYYYKGIGRLPSYNEASLLAFGNACFSADCKCCQGWMRTQGNNPSLQSRLQSRLQYSRAENTNPRWKGIDLQDYDGLTLAERKFLLRSRR